MLLDRLSISTPLDKPTILHLPEAYGTAIARNLLGIIEGSLVYYENIDTITNHICRIVVPIPLHRIIFNLMHTTPIAGYMGEYKALYRIKLRFFWPRLRSDVSDRDKTMRSLYTRQSLAATRSRIDVLLARQFSLRYPPCRPLNARLSYRSQRLHRTHDHYVQHDPICRCSSCS